MAVAVWLLHAVIFEFAQAADVKSTAQIKVDEVQAKIIAMQIGKVEILQIPPQVLTRTSITRELLETGFHYKLVVHDLRGSVYAAEIRSAIKSTMIQEREQIPDLRWAIIFYDTNDVRVASFYFDKYGSAGGIDGTPVIYKGSLFKWLDSTFSATFR